MTEKARPTQAPDEPTAAAAAERPRGRDGEAARDRTGIVAFMARHPVAANLLMVFIVVAGLYSFQTIVQEVNPEASLDTVQVSVIYPGATPQEIEESLIQKIEEAVESVENVKEITATAQEGIGTVLIELQKGASLSRALDEVKSEVDQIQTFPEEAEEPSVRELTTRQSVMRIAIYGQASERSLKELAHQLEDGLAAVPEISYVQTSGVRDFEIHVDISQSRLRALGLSLTDISRIVGLSSLDTPAGAIETGDEEVRLRTVGQNYDQHDFESIVLLAEPDGTRVRLGDVARVHDGFEDADLVSRYNGEPVAFVEVYRTSDERVLDVADAARRYLEEEFAPTLPRGVRCAVWEDNSELLRDRLGLLIGNAVVGLLLVLVALGLFLDIRLATWTAVGIAVTFIGAIFALQLMGSSINMFSLFGFILALGLVVDDAVVVGENIYAEREAGRSGLGASIAGAQRVTVAVIFAVMTTIAAFSPLFAVGGVIGKLLADIPQVVVAVLALSLIEALLILPHHLRHLPPPGTAARNPLLRAAERLQRWVNQRFQRFVDGPLERALRFAIRMPYVIIAGGIALLVLVIVTIPAGILKFKFFPELEADIVTAVLEMPSGTTIAETGRIVERVEDAGTRALEQLDGGRRSGQPNSMARGVYTSVGLISRASGPGGIDQTLAPNLASVQYSLVSADLRDVSASDFEDAWRDALGPVTEARSLSISSTLVSAGDPVNVRLSHPDSEVLAAASRRLIARLTRISGVFAVESDQDQGMREIKFQLKPSARTLGVTLQDVASQVRAAFFGSQAVRVQRGREDVRVYIRLPEEERNSIADVERFRVRVPGGEVALATLADLSFSEAPSVIHRQGGHRVTTITADVDPEVVTGQEVAQIIQSEIGPRLTADYPSLRYEFGGEQEEQEDSFGALLEAFGLAMIAIYALLAIPFKSYVQPIIIMAVIPFGMIGALVGHLLLGLSLGILSVFGLIALAGVIINGSLVMIDFMNENLERGMPEDLAILDAAKTRFRPIVLTALTTFLGVAPITFETSVQAQFLVPMAASLGFGVLFGTAILQLIVPALIMVQRDLHSRLRSTSKVHASA